MKYLFLFLTVILINPSLALGQFSVDSLNSSIGNIGASIETNPKYPEPNTSFTVTLNDYSLVEQINSIDWIVNGVTLDGKKNQRSFDLPTGTTSDPIVIEAVLGKGGSNNLVIKKEIKPLYLDLIIEPQTRTPAFYEGKGLPTLFSTVNITAILSGDINPSDLIYTWKINDTVYDSGPVRSKNSIAAKVPHGQVFLVSVEIKKLDGTLLSSKSTQVRSFNPEVVFYEKNSLYGVIPKPISNFRLIGFSATFVAEPYYLDIQTYNNPGLLEWEVDNKKINKTDGNPYEITLARPEGISSGGSNIGFHVRNLTNLLSGAKDNFEVKF